MVPQIKESLWRKFVDANIETVRWLIDIVGELLLGLVVLLVMSVLVILVVASAFALLFDLFLFVAGIVLIIQSLMHSGPTYQAAMLALQTTITVPVFFLLAFICRKGFQLFR